MRRFLTLAPFYVNHAAALQQSRIPPTCPSPGYFRSCVGWGSSASSAAARSRLACIRREPDPSCSLRLEPERAVEAYSTQWRIDAKGASTTRCRTIWTSARLISRRLLDVVDYRAEWLVAAPEPGAPGSAWSDSATVSRFRRGRPASRDHEPDAGGNSQCAAAARREHHHRCRQHQEAAAEPDRDAAGSREGRRADRSHEHHPRLREDVEFELTFTIVLVVAVIFPFLRTISATVIPSVAVPLDRRHVRSDACARYSLNNLTLMALTISTGFVDDAIVMIENIARFIEKGESPIEAALKGSEQIGSTIISLTVPLIAVLVPLLFMGDIVGRLFREFAVTLAVTILDFSSRLAHADTDDGGAAAEVDGGAVTWAFLSMVRAGVRADHPGIRPHARRGPQVSDADADRIRRHARPDRMPLLRRAQGLLPGPGHRRHPGSLRGATGASRFPKC